MNDTTVITRRYYRQKMPVKNPPAMRANPLSKPHNGEPPGRIER